MSPYTAGPFLLARPGPTLRPGVVSVSNCLATVAPGPWAIEWVVTEEEERLQAAAECGVAADRLPELIRWVTDRFDKGFAWSDVFLEREPAVEFRKLFLPDDFRLLQVGLPSHLVDSFLALAAPAPQQEGYAPTGATGVYDAIVRRRPLEEGARRGIELLGYDRFAGGFDSFRCYVGAEEQVQALGANFNEWGLIHDQAVAEQCLAGADFTPGCADHWAPWLVVEHDPQPGRTTMR